MNVDLDWTSFYEKLADKLLYFKNDRKQLLIDIEEIHDELRIEYPLTVNEEKMSDIDPFSIFALFTDRSSIEQRTQQMSNL